MKEDTNKKWAYKIGYFCGVIIGICLTVAVVTTTIAFVRYLLF